MQNWVATPQYGSVGSDSPSSAPDAAPAPDLASLSAPPLKINLSANLLVPPDGESTPLISTRSRGPAVLLTPMSTHSAIAQSTPLSRLQNVLSRVPHPETPVHRNYPFHLALLDQRKIQQQTPAHKRIVLPSPTEPLPRPAQREHIRATIMLGVAAALFVEAYTVSRNYLTTLHPGVGARCLTLIYV